MRGNLDMPKSPVQWIVCCVCVVIIVTGLIVVRFYQPVKGTAAPPLVRPAVNPELPVPLYQPKIPKGHRATS